MRGAVRGADSDPPRGELQLPTLDDGGRHLFHILARSSSVQACVPFGKRPSGSEPDRPGDPPSQRRRWASIPLGQRLSGRAACYARSLVGLVSARHGPSLSFPALGGTGPTGEPSEAQALPPRTPVHSISSPPAPPQAEFLHAALEPTPRTCAQCQGFTREPGSPFRPSFLTCLPQRHCHRRGPGPQLSLTGFVRAPGCP